MQGTSEHIRDTLVTWALGTRSNSFTSTIKISQWACDKFDRLKKTTTIRALLCSSVHDGAKVYRCASHFNFQCYFEMSSTLNRIPIVDFSALNLDHEQTPGENEPNVKEVAKQMFDAFSTVGFVYITNHGMNQKTVRLCFFLLSTFSWKFYTIFSRMACYVKKMLI